MKYLKNFESIRSEFPDMFSPIDPEDEPQSVPGFETGTIDPDDNEVYPGFDTVSQAEEYKTFLKIVKERNFQETPTEIKINLKKIGEDYCMSIYNYPIHLKKFLNNELVGKYISNGFQNMMTDENVEGIIKRVILTYHDSNDCSNHFSLELVDQPFSENNYCKSVISIDKTKTSANKFNL